MHEARDVDFVIINYSLLTTLFYYLYMIVSTEIMLIIC